MLCVCGFFFFFFKQKTAYEMRISDWSSDVCSSDLLPAMDDDDLRRGRATTHRAYDEATAILVGDALQAQAFHVIAADHDAGLEIGRASCRERVCQYV